MKENTRKCLEHAEKLSDALNLLRDDIIAETDEARTGKIKRKNKTRKLYLAKCGAAAACLCLLATGAFLWNQSQSPDTDSDDGIIVSEDGVTIPPMKVSLSNSSENTAACMIAFFIYQGKSYVQYEQISNNTEIVGEYLGTATGLIDEWTPQEGYVELAGSIRGDFYEVKGYDPSFMLCLKDEAGTLFTYVCNTGITLKYGSELYEDRLHLVGNYSSIEYESRVSWYYGRGELRQLNDTGKVISDFLAQLNAAEFIPRSRVPLKDGQLSIFDTEIYHLYFKMNNGTTVHLRLCEDGYVLYQGLLPLCVQVPKESFDTLLELLDRLP